MKKYIKLLIAPITLLFILCACSEENDSLGFINEDKEASSPDIVLQERDPDLPDVITKKIELDATTRGGEIIGNSDKLLGYSYAIGNSIYGDFDNVRHQIVDISKVKAIDNYYVTAKLLNTNTTSSYAYQGFDRYESNTSSTKKVNSGFKIKVGIFSAGRKKSTTEIFKSSLTENNKTVFGELNLDIRNSSFILQDSEGSRKIYARECLSSTFIRNLYSSTLGDLQNSYGDFVLTGYYTGGKAFAMYAGHAQDGTAFQSNEKSMSKDVSASFNWKNNSASGELGFGKDNGSSTTTGYELRNTEIYIKTFGGNQGGQAIVAAQPLESLELNLTPWLNSLTNTNTHTIVDLVDNGLCPISFFLLEQNFKRRLDDYTNEVLEKRSNFVVPYIEIVRVYVRSTAAGESLYEVAAVLNTRQGDKIVLNDGTAAYATDAELRANSNNTTFLAKANKVLEEKKKYYRLKIVTNTDTKINIAFRSPLSIRLNAFKETDMARYKNPYTGVEYIYDTISRVAFCHLVDPRDGDWILDEYGIREWVESLPVRNISMASLASSYQIIGL